MSDEDRTAVGRSDMKEFAEAIFQGMRDGIPDALSAVTSGFWSRAYDFTRDQGSLVSGFMALAAGAVAYIAGRIQANATKTASDNQLKSEKERVARDVETLRKSLALELRQIAVGVFDSHLAVKKAALDQANPVTTRMLDRLISIPVPLIFPAIADRIALLDGAAMDVMIFYNLVEISRDSAEKLKRNRDPDDISQTNVGVLATALLQAACAARDILPQLRPGTTSNDNKDEELTARVTAAAVEWNQWLIARQMPPIG